MHRADHVYLEAACHSSEMLREVFAFSYGKSERHTIHGLLVVVTCQLGLDTLNSYLDGWGRYQRRCLRACLRPDNPSVRQFGGVHAKNRPL